MDTPDLTSDLACLDARVLIIRKYGEQNISKSVDESCLLLPMCSCSLSLEFMHSVRNFISILFSIIDKDFVENISDLLHGTTLTQSTHDNQYIKGIRRAGCGSLITCREFSPLGVSTLVTVRNSQYLAISEDISISMISLLLYSN